MTGDRRSLRSTCAATVAVTIAILVAACLGPSIRWDEGAPAVTSPAAATLLVGVRWTETGSIVSVVDGLTGSVRDIPAGYRAEPLVVPGAEPMIAIGDWSDPLVEDARLTLYDQATLVSVKTVPLPGNTVPNLPGHATYSVIPELDRAYVIEASPDGYSNALSMVPLSPEQPDGASRPLDYCGPGFVGHLGESRTVIVVCPNEQRTAFLMSPDLAAVDPLPAIAEGDPGSFASGVAFGDADVRICLTGPGDGWRSAIVSVTVAGEVSSPVTVSTESAAAPGACQRWPDGRTAMGLWSGSGSGDYRELAIIEDSNEIESLELEQPVIGPVSLVGETLVAASADGDRVLWFDRAGNVIRSVGDVAAVGGVWTASH